MIEITSGEYDEDENGPSTHEGASSPGHRKARAQGTPDQAVGAGRGTVYVAIQFATDEELIAARARYPSKGRREH